MFFTKITNVYFFQIIKLNREANLKVKHAYLSFSRLLIVFLCDGVDILNTTYHVNLFVQSLMLYSVHIVYFKPLINFLKMETWVFYHCITQNIVEI